MSARAGLPTDTVYIELLLEGSGSCDGVPTTVAWRVTTLSGMSGWTVTSTSLPSLTFSGTYVQSTSFGFGTLQFAWSETSGSVTVPPVMSIVVVTVVAFFGP